MPTLLAESRQKARKAYPCDACCWLDASIQNGDPIEEYYTSEETEAWLQAQAAKFLIQPGETYVRQTIKDGSDLLTFRAIPEIHDICIKYDYYQE